jgi:hypothetical protein
MFLVIGISSCFVLPCFATECHVSNFKIATAALRPRNDTELERFYLDNERFAFFAVIFCAVLLCTVFQTFRSGNCSVFPQNPPNLSLRGGRIFAPDAAIFNGSICHSVTNYGCAERNRTLEGRERKQNNAAIPMFL